jgi:Cu/Ag efflux protein CusF
MLMTRRLLIGLALATLTFGAVPALAQQPDSRGAQQQDARVAQGQLVKVDASAKTIAIKTSAGQMMFRYTDKTTVTGAEGEVAGLATKAGAEVSIKYVQENKENVATEIQVQTKH